MIRSFNALVDQQDAEQAEARSRTGADDALDVLAGIPVRAAEVRAQFARDLEAVRQLDLLVVGTEQRDQQIAEVTRRAATAVARLRGDGEVAVAEITDWMRANETTPDPQEALLAEMREQRAWARLRPQLDAGAMVEALIREAREVRDVASLHALKAELPAYVAASTGRQGMISLGVVDQAVNDALLEVLPEPARGLLDVELMHAEFGPAAVQAVEQAERVVASYGIAEGSEGERALNRELRLQDVRRTRGAA
jgi:hypothetical protein